VSSRIEEFPADLHVAVVTFTDQPYLSQYRQQLGIDFAFVSDPRKRAYEAFGFRRAPWWKVWGPQGILAWLRAMRSGQHGVRRPNEDTLQLGGDVVIDAAARVVAIFRPTGSHDRPSIETLIDAARSVR
jgi:hypothetical protein